MESMRWEQLGYLRVTTNALAPKIVERLAGERAALAHNFDAVGVDLDENVRSINKPIAVHYRIRDRLPQGASRILRDILTLELLYAIRVTSNAFDVTQGRPRGRPRSRRGIHTVKLYLASAP